MQVREIMSSPVVTVRSDATLREAVGKMLDRGVGSVVVVDSGPVGIVTSTDVLRAMYRGGGALADVAVTRVMSRELATATKKTSVTTALDTMERRKVKKLPVRDGIELVGIVTMTDIAQHQPDAVNEVRGRVSHRGNWSN